MFGETKKIFTKARLGLIDLDSGLAEKYRHRVEMD
jgi:hypothetical protein